VNDDRSQLVGKISRLDIQVKQLKEQGEGSRRHTGHVFEQCVRRPGPFSEVCETTPVNLIADTSGEVLNESCGHGPIIPDHTFSLLDHRNLNENVNISVNGAPPSHTSSIIGNYRDAFVASDLTLPTFQNRPDENAVQYIENLEECFSLRNVTIHLRLNVARKSLIGPVSTWLSAMSGNIKDYEDFKRLFIK
jgi:hypothetical protein